MSLRKIQDIKITKNPSQYDDEKVEHPAFAQIRANRGFGGESALYGSDFVHRNVVTIEIHESMLSRGLSSDRHHEGRLLVKVELSEAQWATFVSSLNCGSGVPCTLRARETDYIVPDLPPPRDRVAQFAGETMASAREQVAGVAAMIDKVEKMGLPQKKTKEIVDALRSAKRLAEDNLPFIAKQFGEYMEETVERAKVEINAYALSTLHRAGVAALAADALPIALPSPQKHSDDCPTLLASDAVCTCRAGD